MEYHSLDREKTRTMSPRQILESIGANPDTQKMTDEKIRIVDGKDVHTFAVVPK